MSQTPTKNASASTQAATIAVVSAAPLGPTSVTPHSITAPTVTAIPAAAVNNPSQSQTANNKNKGIITITTNQSTINQLPKKSNIVCVTKTSNGLHTVQEMKFKQNTTAEIGTGLLGNTNSKGGRRSKKTRKQKKNRKQKKTKGRRRH